MSWFSRVANVFRRDRLTREVDEELEAHIAEAIHLMLNPAETLPYIKVLQFRSLQRIEDRQSGVSFFVIHTARKRRPI